VWCLGNELSDLRVRADGLYEENLIRVEVHLIWLVQFLSALDEYVVDLLALGVCLAHHVEDVRQDRMRSAVISKMAEIHCPVRQ
jgi:hypothetical protein